MADAPPNAPPPPSAAAPAPDAAPAPEADVDEPALTAAVEDVTTAMRSLMSAERE